MSTEMGSVKTTPWFGQWIESFDDAVGWITHASVDEIMDFLVGRYGLPRHVLIPRGDCHSMGQGRGFFHTRPYTINWHFIFASFTVSVIGDGCGRGAGLLEVYSWFNKTNVDRELVENDTVLILALDGCGSDRPTAAPRSGQDQKSESNGHN